MGLWGRAILWWVADSLLVVFVPKAREGSGRLARLMLEHPASQTMSSPEFDFVKANIAATLTLVNALIHQGVVDRDLLDEFLAGVISQLPHNRQTLALRVVLDQWRQGLRDGRDVAFVTRPSFEVVDGGRQDS